MRAGLTPSDALRSATIEAGKIAGLFLNGQYLDRAALDELLVFLESFSLFVTGGR